MIEKLRYFAGAVLLRSAAVVIFAGFGGSQALAAGADSAADSTSPEAPASTTGGVDQLAEVVVTAERREQNLQSVPMGAAAFSVDQVQHLGIVDPVALASMVPGVTFNRQSQASLPYIRGVGTSVGQAGDEPSVAFYVDDIYYSSGSGSIAGFNNIDRIEVEKGPQGTLFGRNATGGVIQIFTRNPTPTPEADISFGYGNFDTKRGSIYASSALIDTLSANFDLYGSKQGDGWGKNLGTGDQVYTTDQYGGRAKLLWEPSDTTSALLNVDYDVTFSSVGTGLHAVNGTLPSPPIPPPANFYDVNLTFDPDGVVRQQGASLEVIHDFGWAKATNIAAYRNTYTQYLFDEDMSPVPIINVTTTFHDRELTDELRLESAVGSSLKWTTGFYYFNDIAAEDPLIVTGLGTAPLPDGFIAGGKQTTHSYSGFAEATATVLPDTHLTAGARYTVDQRSLATHYDIPLVGSGIAPNSPQSRSFNKVTDRLILDHNFTQDILGYIGYNRGFKSGLFNTVVFPATPIAPPVAPEVLDAYTAGAKTEWLDRRLRVNAEGFLYKYKNIQIDEVILGSTYLKNAASATIKGIDLDVQAIPVTNLTLTGSVEVMKGRYDSFPNGTLNTYVPGGGLIMSTTDLAGNHTVQTPPFTFSASANYLIPTARMGAFSLTAALSHIGNYYFDADNGKGQLNQGIDRQPLVNLLNLTVDWTAPDDSFDVSLWGRNVTGEKYYSQLGNFPFGAGYSPAPPATYGITGTYHFRPKDTGKQ
jgi:iron complex outermembrane receptor protein